MEEEVWHNVGLKPWSDLYQISNLGNIRLAPRLIPTRNIQGYRCTTLTMRNGTKQTVKLHRLIAATFIRPPTKGEVIHHKNGIRDDNRIQNLEWTTYQGNNDYTAKMGLRPYGHHHPCGKIDAEAAFAMRRDGASYTEIAKHFGATKEAASQMFKRARKAGRFHD